MLARLLPRRAERGIGLSEYGRGSIISLPGGFGMTSDAYREGGDAEQALKNAASWACIRVLMDALSRTPIYAVRETHGIKTKVEPVPRILANPSALVGVDVWRAQLAFSMLTDGNVFGMVADEDLAGRPTQIELRDATKVTDRKVVDGVGQVTIDNKTHKLWPFGDVWHTPGDMVMPGTPFGMSPLTYAQKVIGVSLAAEDFALGFFQDGAHPGLALISDQEMDQSTSEEYKQKVLRSTRGSREPIVMGSGITLQELKLDPSETQFIDLMRFMVEQACRFWGTPPSMVFAASSGQNLTYSNITQEDLHFLKYALEGKFTRIEHAFTELLPGNNYTAPSVPNTLAVMDRDRILRADVKSRYDAYKIAIDTRIKTVNEVRALEDDPPYDDPQYDKPNVPEMRPTLDPTAVNVNGPNMPAPAGPAPVSPKDKGR